MIVLLAALIVLFYFTSTHTENRAKHSIWQAGRLNFRVNIPVTTGGEKNNIIYNAAMKSMVVCVYSHFIVSSLCKADLSNNCTVSWLCYSRKIKSIHNPPTVPTFLFSVKSKERNKLYETQQTNQESLRSLPSWYLSFLCIFHIFVVL